MTAVATLVQAAAALTSFANPIDTLLVLDRQKKDLEAQCKVLKDGIANQYGEGKHRGEKYGVNVVISNVKGTVDYDALCAHFNITAEQLEQFRKPASARITVTPTA